MAKIKIEIPSNDPVVLLAFSSALAEIAKNVRVREAVEASGAKTVATEKTPEDVATVTEPETIITSESPVTVQRDHNGVARNDDFVGKAADPFYNTGKMAGQWKKKKGVSQEDYDAWYASELKQSSPATLFEDEHDTTSAFTTAPAPPPSSDTVDVPTDTGSFMGWVSEMQVAGRLTQARVQEVYTNHGLGMADLFPPNPQETITANIAKLYKDLSA